MDVNDVVQVVVVAAHHTKSMDPAAGRAGVDLLFARGADLQRKLLEYGLLERMQACDQVEELVCTRLTRVRQVFLDLAYVIVGSGNVAPFPSELSPVCTCRAFAR